MKSLAETHGKWGMRTEIWSMYIFMTWSHHRNSCLLLLWMWGINATELRETSDLGQLTRRAWQKWVMIPIRLGRAVLGESILTASEVRKRGEEGSPEQDFIAAGSRQFWSDLEWHTHNHLNQHPYYGCSSPSTFSAKGHTVRTQATVPVLCFSESMFSFPP